MTENKIPENKLKTNYTDSAKQFPYQPDNISHHHPYSHYTESFQQNNDNESLTSLFNSIFNKSNIILVISFLAIYFVAYFGLGMFFNKGSDTSSFQMKLSRLLDIMFLIIIVIFIYAFYTSNSAQQQQDAASSFFDGASSYLTNPGSIFTSLFVLFIFYLTTYLFRIPMESDTKPLFISFIETVAWITFIIIAIIDFFKYVLGISVTNLFSFWDNVPSNNASANASTTANSHPSVSGNVSVSDDNSGNTVSGNAAPTQQNEVFNVANNSYTYDDAQAICAAYGAKLATYDQIEDSYNNGGEWCNYGWSENQSIYFPTQKSTWNFLQTTDDHKNDCGRPGVNGGYIANPYVKFGVNCFGQRPAETADDMARLLAKQQHIYPKSPDDLALESKIQYWKNNAAQLLQLNSFNTKEWSEY